VALAAPATTPSTTQVDQSTQDVLKELEAAHPPPPTPKSAHEPSSPASPASLDWPRLLRLFAPALLTAAACAIACGMLGVFVLLRRESLTALALPQVVAVGAAIGMRLGWPTLPPALAAALLAVAYLAWARQRRGFAVGWNLPALYVTGLCLSFLVIANHGQDVADLQNLFTGIDVAVSPGQAALATPVLLLAGLACAVLWRRWLLLAQAPAAAELAGLRPARWHLLFLTLLAAVLLVGTSALGAVLVLALLFVPAATVLPWARRIPSALIASAIIALASTAAGFYLSNALNWPLSQSIGGVGVALLTISNALHALLRH
jgi:ABC-type Mn2+/Zn2+ transport system permease subunit